MSDRVMKSIEIAAAPPAVWAVLTHKDQIARWMGGAQVESTWQPGAEILFTGKLHRYRYQDRGTVLAAEPERLLQYSHWAALSQRPDLPENRSVVTLRLEPVGEGTRLTVDHEGIHNQDEYGHANYFWDFALNDVKNLAEAPGGGRAGARPRED
jgi:uncharacterized protein YndB with AHSA1/START domain